MSAELVCVSCRRQPAEPRWRPFCSERCKLADLGRWLNGNYRIAGPSAHPDDDEDEDEPHSLHDQKED